MYFKKTKQTSETTKMVKTSQPKPVNSYVS